MLCYLSHPNLVQFHSEIFSSVPTIMFWQLTWAHAQFSHRFDMQGRRIKTAIDNISCSPPCHSFAKLKYCSGRKSGELAITCEINIGAANGNRRKKQNENEQIVYSVSECKRLPLHRPPRSLQWLTAILVGRFCLPLFLRQHWSQSKYIDKAKWIPVSPVQGLFF